MPSRFEFRRYRLPFRAPVRTAHGLWREREGLLVRVEDEAGAVGFGEAAPIPDFGTETIDVAAEACRKLGDRVDDATLATLPANLPCLRHALAAALRPETSTPAVASLGVAALLPAGRAALAQVPAKAELGFRVFKWKVGVADLADELALLDDLCAALPNGAKLRLDANGAWERRHAERWLERAADRPIEFVEQPAPPKNRDLLLGLAHDFPTPLALDESVAGNADIAQWLGDGWPGVYVLKPSLLADLSAALAQLEHAKADVVFSSALETAVGARTALQAAFAWRTAKPRALGFGVYPLFADARCDGPFAAPFLRWEDVQRLDPAATWAAVPGQ